jgi:hypothetical protein
LCELLQMEDMTVKTVTISIRIEEDRLAYLKKLSHKLSLERNEDLSYSDLIREAIEKQFKEKDKNEKT